MLLRILIIILFVAMLASLASGWYYFCKDRGAPRRRLLHALGTRVTLALLLLAAIAWGLASGQLGSLAPWDRTLHNPAPESPPR